MPRARVLLLHRPLAKDTCCVCHEDTPRDDTVQCDFRFPPFCGTSAPRQCHRRYCRDCAPLVALPGLDLCPQHSSDGYSEWLSACNSNAELVRWVRRGKKGAKNPKWFTRFGKSLSWCDEERRLLLQASPPADRDRQRVRLAPRFHGTQNMQQVLLTPCDTTARVTCAKSSRHAKHAASPHRGRRGRGRALMTSSTRFDDQQHGKPADCPLRLALSAVASLLRGWVEPGEGARDGRAQVTRAVVWLLACAGGVRAIRLAPT